MFVIVCHMQEVCPVQGWFGNKIIGETSVQFPSDKSIFLKLPLHEYSVLQTNLLLLFDLWKKLHVNKMFGFKCSQTTTAPRPKKKKKEINHDGHITFLIRLSILNTSFFFEKQHKANPNFVELATTMIVQ